METIVFVVEVTDDVPWIVIAFALSASLMSVGTVPFSFLSVASRCLMQSLLDVRRKPEAMLLPSCAMALWTFGNLVRLGLARSNAVKKREVSLKYYKTYSDPEGEPLKVGLLAQHVENLFEAPPLFHCVSLALYATRLADTTTVALGWLYFLFRVIHTYIHTGSNKVSHRFYSYIASTIVLTSLWGVLAARILLK